ncbi:hypothetical protein HHK36_004466 [Tetracentron sinense]|uniref:Uncharacterized protein n=1 Tax=Tetracentron sinense TaxID=13715 RepID=A0A834ZVB0_TETSI|nr:hypothetical protein HHK36_004466 [Tetracentron sinense]
MDKAKIRLSSWNLRRSSADRYLPLEKLSFDLTLFRFRPVFSQECSKLGFFFSKASRSEPRSEMPHTEEISVLIVEYLWFDRTVEHRTQKHSCGLTCGLLLYLCWPRACVELLLRVMPLTRLVADAFGVVTICLVTLLVLLSFLCLLYSVHFRSRIRRQGFVQLGYFNGPWIIRITFILFSIWWGFGEIVRLSLFRREGRLLNALSLKWQETVCKYYILSNLGFAEPCLFLTLVFLLRASLQMRSGTLSRQWNGKTAGYVLLYCLPVFVLQLIVVLVGPKFNNEESDPRKQKLPHYFTSTATSSKMDYHDNIALCTYPLLSTILLGLFATLLTTYLLWVGNLMVSLVINKGLQRRVYMLLFSVSGFLPLRVLLLGLSVLSSPEHLIFEALTFSAFLALISCAGMGICMLVYCPVADSLALRSLLDLQARARPLEDDHNDSTSPIANQSLLEGSSATSLGRNSDASTKRGSISFRTMVKEKEEKASTEEFEELSLFSPGTHWLASPPGSPPLPGQPMLPLKQILEP